MSQNYKIVERLHNEADYADQVQASTQFGSPSTARQAASLIQELGEALEMAKTAVDRAYQMTAGGPKKSDARAVRDRIDAILSKLKEA